MSTRKYIAREVVGADQLQHCERCGNPILPGVAFVYLKDDETGNARYLHTVQWGRDLWKRKAKSARLSKEWYRLEVARLRAKLLAYAIEFEPLPADIYTDSPQGER